MADWEGSKKDRMMDRKMARKRKMSMREWEASDADAEHDRGRGKGYATGGRVRGMGAAKKGGGYVVS